MASYANDDNTVWWTVVENGEGSMVRENSRAALHYIVYVIPQQEGESVVPYETFTNEYLNKKAPFDNSRSRGIPFNITIGKEETIEGLELALKKLKEGDDAIIGVGSSKAFGAVENPHGFHSFGGTIPANSSLIFQLSVLDVDNDYVNSEKESADKKLDRAIDLRLNGNSYYKKKDYDRALQKYRRACNVALETKDVKVDTTPELFRKKTTVLLPCYNNMAAVFLDKKDYNRCISSCEKALEIDPNNTKCWFRLSKCRTERKEYEESLKLLNKILSIEPENKEVALELARVKKLSKEADKQSAKLFGGMFGKLGDTSEKGLYEDEIKRNKELEKLPKMKKCIYCDTDVEEIQYARHIIKYHSNQVSEDTTVMKSS